MDTCRIGAGAHKARGARALAAGLAIAMGAGGAGTAFAQATAPAAAASDAPSESLRRQALSPYRFILQHANTPARTKPAPATEAKAPEPKRPAPPVEQAAVQPRAVPAVAVPSPEPQAVPAQPRVPEPVAAVAPRPAEPPPIAAVRREIIPVKTEEPRLTASLLRERPSGVVKVAFKVRPDGSTADVKVVSSTNRSLNRASVEAVSGWTFEPVDEVLLVETELAYKYD